MVDVIGRAKVIVESDVDSQQVSGIGTKVGNLLGNSLKAGVLGAAATVGAGLGTVLFKGFERLDAIDQAEAKLRGLGNSTKTIETIMENALASVKGTAFGLGDAASIAAAAVASGVEPGKELERTLRLVGDAATIGGTSLSEMGAIFGKVSATGKIQGEVLNQLGERGIPIIQLLADTLGVTNQEVLDLASNGEISFAEFQDAIEKGMGGSALEAGETFRGALDNVGAALGRVGAALLGEGFESGPDILQGLTEKLDDMEPAARKVGEHIGTIVDKLQEWSNSKAWKELKGSMKGWGEDLLVVGGALASIVSAMEALTPQGTGKGLLDFLIELEDHTTPLKVVADLIRVIQNAANNGEELLDFLSIGPIRFDNSGAKNPTSTSTVPSSARAVGGPANGWTVVGERGPELLRLPAGSYVNSSINSEGMLAASGGGDTFNITHIGNSDGLVQKLNWNSRYRRVGVQQGVNA